MHLPHAVQQCPSCYMYCISRGPTSSGGPPVPPHSGNHSQEGHGCHPQRTQPRAVTLPHPPPCSHTLPPSELCGPRPRFQSLPHHQVPPKQSAYPHASLVPYPGTVNTRMGPPPSHNIVGVPVEESPPPLPPHGPPPLPPAHLISRHNIMHLPQNDLTLSANKGDSRHNVPKDCHPYIEPTSKLNSSPVKSQPHSLNAYLPSEHKNQEALDHSAIYQTIDEIKCSETFQKPNEEKKIDMSKCRPSQSLQNTSKNSNPDVSASHKISSNTNSLPHNTSLNSKSYTYSNTIHKSHSNEMEKQIYRKSLSPTRDNLETVSKSCNSSLSRNRDVKSPEKNEFVSKKSPVDSRRSNEPNSQHSNNDKMKEVSMNFHDSQTKLKGDYIIEEERISPEKKQEHTYVKTKTSDDQNQIPVADNSSSQNQNISIGGQPSQSGQSHDSHRDHQRATLTETKHFNPNASNLSHKHPHISFASQNEPSDHQISSNQSRSRSKSSNLPLSEANIHSAQTSYSVQPLSPFPPHSHDNVSHSHSSHHNQSHPPRHVQSHDHPNQSHLPHSSHSNPSYSNHPYPDQPPPYSSHPNQTHPHHQNQPPPSYTNQSHSHPPQQNQPHHKTPYPHQSNIHAPHPNQPHSHPSRPNQPHPHHSQPNHPLPNQPHPRPNQLHSHPNQHPHPNQPHPLPNQPHPLPNQPHPLPNQPHPLPNQPHPHPNQSHPPHPNQLHPHLNQLHPPHPNQSHPPHSNQPHPPHPNQPHLPHPNQPHPPHPNQPNPPHPNQSHPPHPNQLHPLHPNQPHPPHPNQPHPPHPNQPHPPHPNQPHPPHPNQPHPPHPNQPHPPHPNQSHPPHPNQPQPHSLQPKLSQPHPNPSYQNHPQSHPPHSNQPHPHAPHPNHPHSHPPHLNQPHSHPPPHPNHPSHPHPPHPNQPPHLHPSQLHQPPYPHPPHPNQTHPPHLGQPHLQSYSHPHSNQPHPPRSSQPLSHPNPPHPNNPLHSSHHPSHPPKSHIQPPTPNPFSSVAKKTDLHNTQIYRDQHVPSNHQHPSSFPHHPLPNSTYHSYSQSAHPQGKNPHVQSHFHSTPGNCPCGTVHPYSSHTSDHSNCDPTRCSHQGTEKFREHCERQGTKVELVPPPPPLPPPPVLPPVTFDQLRYACLPHQLLVPPPRPQELILGCPEHGHHHISSSSKGDRPYCGPGPPGRNRPLCGPISKAHSLDVPSLLNKSHHHVPVSNGSHHHLVRRPQAVSQSAVMGGSRHGLSPRGVAVDDCGSRSDRWRRNGSQSAGQSYELSQDLADKRLEMLERRYGGERARRAATTIQRAYRHYAMHKKFRAITATAKAQEKRLSRRFTLESSEWIEGSGNGHTCDAEQRIRSEFDKLNRNLNASVYGVDSNRRPSRSLSMRDSRTCPNARGEMDQLNDSSLYCHSPSASSSPSAPLINGEHQQHISHQQNSELNSYTSSRELKYFPSEDSGFGSQDIVSKQPSASHRSKSVGRGNASKKVPPEVPRRSSSIKNESGGNVDSFVAYTSANHRVQCTASSLNPPSSHSSDGGSDRGALRRSADNGSLSSVQSSGSDSSLSQSTSDRTTPLSQEHHENQEFVTPTSPIWKRKTQMSHTELQYDDKRLSNISENSEDSCHSISSEGLSYSQYPHGHSNSRHAHIPHHHQSSFSSSHEYKISEVLRKRQYRVGLNLFNKKPERGINYLIGRSFLENSPQAVAKFLLTRKGLSKQMIGEYLGNLQNPFNMSVLECFATEIDLSGMQVDVALRKFQTHFRMPGEAQKIERLMQVFAQRYCQCNRDIVAKLRDPETIFVLAFAIIMLNTDLHTASLKAEKRMKLEDFIKNLRGVDDGCDIEREMLEGMYHRIKAQEFRPGHDHVTQVMKVQQTIVGKKPVLALPHRRLVCYCRLYEVPDPNKKERVGLHQREVFLFNDLLVVTKIFSKKKNSVTYTFRQSFQLAGLSVNTKEATHYSFLLEIKQRVDNKVLATFNARNEHDRTKFCEDLRESILEMDEMENLRIEGELERQKANLRASRPNSTAENRDSGVADMELITPGEKSCTLKPEGTLKRTTLSNSLLDIHEAGL